MTVKLHRCSNTWLRIDGHPCWRVQKALDEQGVDYAVVKGPLRRGRREALKAATGQSAYPAVELEDGTWYRAESAEMARTIREGRIREQHSHDPGSAGP